MLFQFWIMFGKRTWAIFCFIFLTVFSFQTTWHLILFLPSVKINCRRCENSAGFVLLITERFWRERLIWKHTFLGRMWYTYITVRMARWLGRAMRSVVPSCVKTEVTISHHRLSYLTSRDACVQACEHPICSGHALLKGSAWNFSTTEACVCVKAKSHHLNG